MMKTQLIYKEAAVLARLAGEEMLAQLPWMTIKPKVVLDIGCGVGEHSTCLKQQYPKANLFAIDLSLPMLQEGKKNEKKEINWLNANATQLPFSNQSVDL